MTTAAGRAACDIARWGLVGPAGLFVEAAKHRDMAFFDRHVAKEYVQIVDGKPVDFRAQLAEVMLLSALEGLSPAVAAAAYLGGIKAELPQRAREIAGAFLVKESASKPAGFYTWREDLRRIAPSIPGWSRTGAAARRRTSAPAYGARLTSYSSRTGVAASTSFTLATCCW